MTPEQAKAFLDEMSAIGKDALADVLSVDDEFRELFFERVDGSNDEPAEGGNTPENPTTEA